MIDDGIHLLELLLVNVTISPSFALCLVDLSPSNTVELIRLTIMLLLFVSLFHHLCLDLRSLSTYTVHDLLSFGTEVGLRPFKAEVERW